mmetsp:Transcript_103181/g.296034  ORF Transcript_103181/g.296034 Transcript_103181/m.296034 type:complete len:226 (-) Transcript_103181:445-1122(-)
MASTSHAYDTHMTKAFTTRLQLENLVAELEAAIAHSQACGDLSRYTSSKKLLVAVHLAIRSLDEVWTVHQELEPHTPYSPLLDLALGPITAAAAEAADAAAYDDKMDYCSSPEPPCPSPYVSVSPLQSPPGHWSYPVPQTPSSYAGGWAGSVSPTPGSPAAGWAGAVPHPPTCALPWDVWERTLDAEPQVHRLTNANPRPPPPGAGILKDPEHRSQQDQERLAEY